MRNGLNRSILHKPLLVQDACAHDQIKCMNAVQLRDASYAYNTVGFLSVPSLRQAQRQDCEVQESLQLLGWSLMFLAYETFSSCA